MHDILVGSDVPQRTEEDQPHILVQLGAAHGGTQEHPQRTVTSAIHKVDTLKLTSLNQNKDFAPQSSRENAINLSDLKKMGSGFIDVIVNDPSTVNNDHHLKSMSPTSVILVKTKSNFKEQ